MQIQHLAPILTPRRFLPLAIPKENLFYRYTSYSVFNTIRQNTVNDQNAVSLNDTQFTISHIIQNTHLPHFSLISLQAKRYFYQLELYFP